MKKQTPALGQIGMAGGGLNTMPLDYMVFISPVEDQRKWGPLAHVTIEIREKILRTGFGEIDMHVNYIQREIKRKKKMTTKPLDLPRRDIKE